MGLASPLTGGSNVREPLNMLQLGVSLNTLGYSLGVVVGVPRKRKLVRVQVFLPEDIARRFEVEAEAKGLSLSSYLRAWIIEKLSEVSRK